MKSTTFPESEKVIHEFVKFENILINYDVSKNFEVEFSIDKAVKGSSRDWIGIFHAGWNSYESFMAHESALGLPCDESGRRRKVKFDVKYLQDAKAGVPYQFVYVNKYLEILGVSQYFQFIGNNQNGFSLANDTICEGSFSPKLESSPLKYQDDKKHENEGHPIVEDIMRVSSTGFPNGHFHSNCKLYSVSKWKNSCTSCYQCKSIFQLKESHDDLLEKIKLYQEHNFSLRNRVDRLEKLLQWQDKEQELNTCMLHFSEVLDNAIRSSIYGQGDNKGVHNPNYFDWDFTSKELFLKAIIGQQEVTIRDLNKVICELGYIDKPKLSYCPSTSLEDTVKTLKAEERVVAEVYDVNNNTSEEEF